MFKVLWEMNKCSGMSWFLYFFIFWKSTINMWKIKWYFYTKEFKGWENFERGLAMMAEKKDLVSSPGLVGTPEWTPVYRAVTDDQDWGYEDLQLKMIRSHMRWVGGVESLSRPIPLGGRPTNWEDDHSCRGSLRSGVWASHQAAQPRGPAPGSRIPRNPRPWLWTPVVLWKVDFTLQEA